MNNDTNVKPKQGVLRAGMRCGKHPTSKPEQVQTPAEQAKPTTTQTNEVAHAQD